MEKPPIRKLDDIDASRAPEYHEGQHIEVLSNGRWVGGRVTPGSGPSLERTRLKGEGVVWRWRYSVLIDGVSVMRNEHEMRKVTPSGPKCPLCGSESVYMHDWTASSIEDRTNTGLLEEHQCRNNGCNISFWIGQLAVKDLKKEKT
jgi:hypothetical protein